MQHKRFPELLLFAFLATFPLTSCSPSEQAIQTALAETNVAKPSETSTATAIIPTATITPEPTATNTIEPSPTADLRVIREDPKTYLLQKEDLPEEAKYYLPNAGWISPHHNEEILSSWGREKGLEYLEATGRIDGWVVYYARGSSTVRAPEEVFGNTIMFETASGAYIALHDNPLGQVEGFEPLNIEIEIGDGALVWIRREMQSNGNNYVDLLVEFIYRNYEVRLAGSGWEDEVTIDFMTEVANNVLARLMEAPLSNP